MKSSTNTRDNFLRALWIFLITIRLKLRFKMFNSSITCFFLRFQRKYITCCPHLNVSLAKLRETIGFIIIVYFSASPKLFFPQMIATKACPICRSHLGEEKAKTAVEHLKEKSKKAPEKTVSYSNFKQNSPTIHVYHRTVWTSIWYRVLC